MATHLYTYVKPTSKKDLEKACQVLRDGGTIAYPTDVNWAVGCDPTQKKAITTIQRIKSVHPKEQPFSLMCNSLSMVSQVCTVETAAFRLLKKILPGPYTVLLPRHKTLFRQINSLRSCKHHFANR